MKAGCADYLSMLEILADNRLSPSTFRKPTPMLQINLERLSSYQKGWNGMEQGMEGMEREWKDGKGMKTNGEWKESKKETALGGGSGTPGDELFTGTDRRHHPHLPWPEFQQEVGFVGLARAQPWPSGLRDRSANCVVLPASRQSHPKIRSCNTLS